MTIVAVSDDGTMQCGGQMVDIPVLTQAANTFVTIVINCITDARYGGIGVDGEFNQCAEYTQIIVSPTTQSTGGDPVNVDVWCYDPDGSIDSPLVAVLFITAQSSVDPNPANWVACGSSPNYQYPPTPEPCPHADPPTVSANQSANIDLSCNIGDDPLNPDLGTQCVVIVSVSDDGFASGGTDPFGCDGTDDNANAVIPVFCQSIAVCGDSVVESPEACDPPGSPNGNNEFCDAQCRFFDPCADPLNPPASCPAPAEPQCQSTTCSDSGGTITCGIQNAPDGTACSGGACVSGVCEECFTDADCDDTNDCTADTCVANSCANTPEPPLTACGAPGYTCDGMGACEPALRILVTNDDGFAGDGIDAVVEGLILNPNNVVIVCAPATNQSGTSDDTNCGTLATTSETTLSGYPVTSIDGCPADAVNYALANLYTPAQQPHVVISGLNRGQNVSEGIVTATSGTVGAAKTAVVGGVPALACSQGASQGLLGGASTTYDYPSGVAEVLSWLSANRATLFAGTASTTDVINLNIPSCDAGSIRGTETNVALAPDSVGALGAQDCTSTLLNPAYDTESLNNGFTTYSTVPLSAFP